MFIAKFYWPAISGMSPPPLFETLFCISGVCLILDARYAHTICLLTRFILRRKRGERQLLIRRRIHTTTKAVPHLQTSVISIKLLDFPLFQSYSRSSSSSVSLSLSLIITYCFLLDSGELGWWRWVTIRSTITDLNALRCCSKCHSNEGNVQSKTPTNNQAEVLTTVPFKKIRHANTGSNKWYHNEECKQRNDTENLTHISNTVPMCNKHGCWHLVNCGFSDKQRRTVRHNH